MVGYKSSPEAIDDYSVFGMIIGEWEESERIASLKGWTWKSGKGFEIDATITEQEIDMTGRLNDTGAIDDLVENMTKVKKRISKFDRRSRPTENR